MITPGSVVNLKFQVEHTDLTDEGQQILSGFWLDGKSRRHFIVGVIPGKYTQVSENTFECGVGDVVSI
jgi:hypothetical protein